MTGVHSPMILVAGLALCLEGAAAADEPQADDATAEPNETAPAVAPGSAITTVPVLATRSGAAAAAARRRHAGTPGGANPDGKILRVANPRFGDVGQVALNGALSGSIGHLGYDSSDASSTNIQASSPPSTTLRRKTPPRVRPHFFATPTASRATASTSTPRPSA